MLSALTTAPVGPLLIARGADPLELGVDSSDVSLFGLGAGWFGPRLATRTGSVASAIRVALVAARSVLATVPIAITLSSHGWVPVLIAVLLIWAAGEGIALPLWMTYLAGFADPRERGRWLAWRATVAAAAAVGPLLPLLALLVLASTPWALRAGYTIAVVAGVVGARKVRRLFAMIPAQPSHAVAPRQSLGDSERRFITGVFCFWFGAALNRPVLLVYLVDQLGAPAAYVASAAIAAGLTDIVVQRGWGRYGDEWGACALPGLSGLGAGATPLLWTVMPNLWLGLLVEAIAAGCWLGHLLGLMLRAVELVEDDAARASFVARTSVAQGTAAALAPLVAVAIVQPVGVMPFLVASGLICLGATGIIGAVPRRSWTASSVLRQRLHVLPGKRVVALFPVPIWSGVRRPRGRDHAATASWPDALPALVSRAPEMACRVPVRAYLPLSLERASSADCPSCLGFGCRACYGIGLG